MWPHASHHSLKPCSNTVAHLNSRCACCALRAIIDAVSNGRTHSRGGAVVSTGHRRGCTGSLGAVHRGTTTRLSADANKTQAKTSGGCLTRHLCDTDSTRQIDVLHVNRKDSKEDDNTYILRGRRRPLQTIVPGLTRRRACSRSETRSRPVQARRAAGTAYGTTCTIAAGSAITRASRRRKPSYGTVLASHTGRAANSTREAVLTRGALRRRGRR